MVGLILMSTCLIGCGKKEEKQEDNNEEQKLEYVVDIDGMNLTPGQNIDVTKLKEGYDYFEIPSCAFEGIDKVYTYDDYELTIANVDGVDKVYSVYYSGDGVSTKEGIKVSDEVAKVKDIYGEDFTLDGEDIYYSDGNLNILFLTNNDVVVGITYTLITKDNES